MHVWGIRVRLQVDRRIRDLALFDLAIDSKLRGCDVVALRVGDVVSAGSMRRRAIVLQQKTGRPVQFELTDQTRQSIARWLSTRLWKRLVVPQPAMARRASLDPPVFAASQMVGGSDWAGAFKLWNAQPAQDQGQLALQENR
jgi:integrase